MSLLPVPDSMSAAPVMLEYSRVGPVHASRARRAFLFALTVPVAVTPFLSFTYDISPLYAVREIAREYFQNGFRETTKIGLIASPFFVGCVLFIWQLRLLVYPKTKRIEQIAAMMIASFSAALTFTFAGSVIPEILQNSQVMSPDALSVLSGVIMLALGAGLMIWLRWRRAGGNAMASVALLVAYLANGIMCLGGFRDNLEMGAWFTAIGSGLLILNLILLSIRPTL